MINAVVFDLDGVVRHFDPAHVLGVEEAHALGSGAITEAAFEPGLLEAVTTGRISRAEWVARVDDALGTPGAATEWAAEQGVLDDAVLALVGELRGAGQRTAILTNGTDTIPEEARSLGLLEHFERVFNSAEIGHTKPDVRAFEFVLRELRLDPHEVFFTDDSAHKLRGARALGMQVHHFAADGGRSAVEGLRLALAEAGVLPATPPPTAAP